MDEDGKGLRDVHIIDELEDRKKKNERKTHKERERERKKGEEEQSLKRETKGKLTKCIERSRESNRPGKLRRASS